MKLTTNEAFSPLVSKTLKWLEENEQVIKENMAFPARGKSAEEDYALIQQARGELRWIRKMRKIYEAGLQSPVDSEDGDALKNEMDGYGHPTPRTM